MGVVVGGGGGGAYEFPPWGAKIYATDKTITIIIYLIKFKIIIPNSTYGLETILKPHFKICRTNQPMHITTLYR